MSRFFDRNGVEITPGSSVKLPDGTVERAVLLEDETLGYNCVNPAFRQRHPWTDDEYYEFPAHSKLVNGEWVRVVDAEVVCTETA